MIYIPNKQMDGTFIRLNEINSLQKDIIMFFDRIHVISYRWSKIPLSKKFVNSIIDEPFAVFSPFNVRSGNSIKYYFDNNFLHIYTNYVSNQTSKDDNSNVMFYKRTFNVAIIDMILIGERWDTQVLNDLKDQFER